MSCFDSLKLLKENCHSLWLAKTKGRADCAVLPFPLQTLRETRRKLPGASDETDSVPSSKVRWDGRSTAGWDRGGSGTVMAGTSGVWRSTRGGPARAGHPVTCYRVSIRRLDHVSSHPLTCEAAHKNSFMSTFVSVNL